MTQADRFSEEEVRVGFEGVPIDFLLRYLFLPSPPSNLTLCSLSQVKQMFAAFPPDVCGNLDYRNLCYVITHGEEKD